MACRQGEGAINYLKGLSIFGLCVHRFPARVCVGVQRRVQLQLSGQVGKYLGGGDRLGLQSNGILTGIFLSDTIQTKKQRRGV